MGINIWNNLIFGIYRPIVGQKRKLWYQYMPGILAFRAVTFGRKRKLWFRETEYLILYRNDLGRKSYCKIAWIKESLLIDRYDK
jgi:hypothetical protein